MTKFDLYGFNSLIINYYLNFLYSSLLFEVLIHGSFLEIPCVVLTGGFAE